MITCTLVISALIQSDDLISYIVLRYTRKVDAPERIALLLCPLYYDLPRPSHLI
jgi:hypothetical protein